ncbi:glycosyltransferase, exosortase A system-associated [Herbaspirillum seropedicae]|uniref:Membrane-anchored group 1 glycosyltransferase protein n=1 Tax=Herbaspirillum seropedicae (strain SmR1) TaxID=757424 RepID=D8IYR1_HERSS|nr:TIGR04063 family PEP-CTERM/XrtA system glycosyltransferase [Herbaspirillum seropedicae]ADJ64246.1 membrane-anchored group 1 glycosyltransferase protein [Herbaspirillum seropedicae SmR1]AKN66197.1 glycosyl transferase family 1 [Herbaspirillum seropedicae]NQE30716.1 glycosyl transferase family 1 [Herbaspirillum seropedicae]UMU22189.1 glycosyltransferase, exosortase A system-associated [Herbaspirillum seropedicae]
MHILHILDHSIPLHSGYTFRTLSILKQQRALGWQTSHITSAKQGAAGAAEEEVDGWRFYRTPPATGLLARLPVLNQLAVIQGLARRLEEVARQVRPDVLHAHSPALNAIAALRVGRRLGIPVVYEVRAFWEDAAVDHGTSRAGGLRYRLTRALETYALKRADAVTTICEGLRADIAARGVPLAKMTVIPNAVNIDDFSLGQQADPALARQLGLEGKTLLGFIGSFYAYEGLPVLVQALPQLLAGNPDVRLLLVGGGPQERALHALAAELGVSDKVVFAGRVPHEQVQRYYNLIDVLVYPRLKMRLTDLVTPLKPLEAMAQGRLVVASDVGGHRELISDGRTGVLFAAGSPEALAQKVLALLAEPARWPQLRAAGRHFVETERNWAASVARYQQIYPRLVAASAGIQ